MDELDKQVVRALVQQGLVIFDLNKNRTRLVAKSIDLRSGIDEKNAHIELLGESIGSDACRVDINILERNLALVLDDIKTIDSQVAKIEAHVV